MFENVSIFVLYHVDVNACLQEKTSSSTTAPDELQDIPDCVVEPAEPVVHGDFRVEALEPGKEGAINN
ncbi:hypothetical protein H6P81_019622 [Aristolochia fimbriata]|uniref:Uncharacterized protein n=1 Tax=Aristolochia fimbriata TaxID=158543 RepID=A0AAV7DVE8_ARIFI|nr:hypothetical protein H6P81_019622 [Aristolochia fimbriata]